MPKSTGKSGFKLQGLKRVLTNLNAEVRKIEGRTPAGLNAAGQLVMAYAVPITPHKTGHLVGLRYVDLHKHGTTPYVELGFKADYAVFVHEIEKQNYSKPGTSWKFLEKALAANKDNILQVIRTYAEVK